MEHLLLKELEKSHTPFKRIKYKKGGNILFANDIPQGIYIVESGYVRNFVVSSEGRELTSNLFGFADVFSAQWLFNDTPPSHTYEALTETHLIRVSKPDFLKFLNKSPQASIFITKKILTNLTKTLTRLETTLTGSAATRVAIVLFSLAHMADPISKATVTINLPFTHSSIASMTGLSRETVSLEIEKLEKERIIKQQKRKFIILSLEKLKEKAKVEE